MEYSKNIPSSLRVFTNIPHLFAGFIGKPVDWKHIEMMRVIPEIAWGNIKQVHKTTIVSVAQSLIAPEGQRIEADGMYTRNENEGCITPIADCISGLFYNTQTQEIAAVHAGWKGLAQKIFTKYLSKFEDVSGVHVALSPSLGFCCSEFSDPFSETPDFFHEHIEQRDEKYFVNLWGIAKQELLNAGIDEQNITMPMCCTKCNAAHWWSHRNGDKERNIAFIVKNQE